MARIDYDRDAVLAAEIDAADGEPAAGGVAMLVRTEDDGAYPEEPGKVYACAPATISAPPTEGASPALAAGDGRIYAANLGTGVPDPGTYLIATRHGGAWTIRFDG